MSTFRSDLRIDPPIKELRKVLKELDSQLPKSLNKVLKSGAEIVAADARSRAPGVSRQGAAAASQIKSSGTAQGAIVALAASKGKPYALAALLGMTRRTGWFASSKFSDYKGPSGQHLPWIGTGWQVGDANSGPRAINPAFSAKREEFITALLAELDEFGAKTFPDAD